MTTYNTGNPLGSADPRDLYDNAENFDPAVNDLNSETWIDRFGVERLTIQGALNRFNDVIIAGGQIFESEEAGRAAVQDGQYYYSVSDDPDVSKILWRRIDADNSELIADEPSAEFVKSVAATSNAAIDLASQPGLVSGEFYTDDDEQPVYSITDEDGNALASWNQQGEMDANPSLEMAEKSQRARTEFHTEDGQPAFALTDEEGRPLYAVDENVQPIVPFISEFHTEDGQPEFAWTDKKGVIFYGIDGEGRNVVGGGGLGEVPNEPLGLNAPQPYWHYGRLLKSFPATALSTAGVPSLTQPHTSQYDFYDSLMAQNPDYISRELVGQSTLGNNIYAYTFDSISNFTSGISLFTVLPPIEIVITSGIHGNERTAQAITMMIVDGFVNRWRENPIFNRLRWQCRVRVIPCCNPDGMDAGTRWNTNGVDVNRNFPTDWDSEGNRSGPSAASEIETQVLMTIPSLFPDATAYFDMHTHAGTGYIQWLLACNQRDANLIVEHARMSVGQQVYVAGGEALPPLLGDIPPGGMVRQFVLGSGGNAGFIHETGDNNFNGNTVTQRRHSLYASLDLINRAIEREEKSRMEISL